MMLIHLRSGLIQGFNHIFKLMGLRGSKMLKDAPKCMNILEIAHQQYQETQKAKQFRIENDGLRCYNYCVKIWDTIKKLFNNLFCMRFHSVFLYRSSCLTRIQIVYVQFSVYYILHQYMNVSVFDIFRQYIWMLCYMVFIFVL